nr:peptidoglycan binding lysin subgroup,peptidoglycan binding lysin domain [Hymenolepis microstoma]
MSVADIQVSDKTEDKQELYIVESGDSITSVAAKFDLTPSRLCQINKLCSSHLFAGQRLKVVKEESEHSKPKDDNQETTEKASEPESTSDIDTNTPSIEKRYRQIFKRIIGAEILEKSCPAKVLQADKKETNNPLAAGCLKVDARFCPDLNTCIKGTLIATIETLMFAPLDESDQIAALCQSAVEMRYDSVRSVAAYTDASVFVFTKRPRFQRQATFFSNADDSCNTTRFIDASSGNVTQHEEPVLQVDEVFLCCTVQRNRLTSGGAQSPSACSSGAQWFIISRKRIEDLDNFLVGSKLGFASVVSPELLTEKSTSGKGEGERVEKSRSIHGAIGSLIPRKMTLSFRHSHDSNENSSQSYIGRNLGRLIHRTASMGQKNPKLNPTAVPEGDRRRPTSIGCSEELFSDHAAIDVLYQDPSTKTGGEDSESIFFERSTSSTPSFADEKEVFDVLRQTSLLWELVSEQEFLQRCVLAEAEKEEEEEACDSWITDSSIFSVLPPPAAIFQSTILTKQVQIEEIFNSIPLAAQTFDWSLTFSTELHGFSLATLYRRCEEFSSGDLETNYRSEGIRTAGDFTERALITRHKNLCHNLRHQPSALLIKDTTDHVMGAYLSCHPRVQIGSFYGTGETFVFHWLPSSKTPCSEDIPSAKNVIDNSQSCGNFCFKKYAWSGKNSFFISGDSDVLAVGCSNGRSALRIDASLNRGRSEPCETFDNPELTPSEDFFIYALELWSLS